MAMAQGMANADYRRPCPGCLRPVRKGDAVIKVALPHTTSWWHQGCRREYVAVLCLPDRPP